MLGISIPWIDSKKDDDNDDANSDNVMNAMKDSKTKIYTYKIGSSISAKTSLNKFFTIYGSETYAYQTEKLKNDYANTDLTVNGTFQEYDFGLGYSILIQCTKQIVQTGDRLKFADNRTKTL